MSKMRCSGQILWATPLLLLPLVGACDEDGVGPLEDDAMLSVYLKDAPGDVDSVWVQIDDIVLVGDGGQESVLSEPTALLNLTALRDSAAALAEDVPLDTATFREVRLVLGGAVLQTSSGEVYTMGDAVHPHGTVATGQLQCPSCAQSGIKVKLSGDLSVEEGTNGLLLDFDVSQSFGRQAGNSGMWVMHPVIHASAGEPDDIDDGDGAGEISGIVVLGVDDNGDTLAIPECGGAARSLTAFVPTATSKTLTDDEGGFLTFAGEVESEDDGFSFEIEVTDFDTFALAYAAATEFTDTKLVWQATVAPAEAAITDGANEVGDVVYTVTAASCEALAP